TGLGRRLRDLAHISGAAVLETGEIALLLRSSALMRAALSAPGTADAASDHATPATARRRVLVVDDSATTRSLVRSILEGVGYEIAVAVDGADAWAKLQERLPDLIVSDVDMPRMDGFGLCEAVRRSPRTRDLPVVLVTALGSDRDRARGMEAGADAYVVKAEFDQGTLIETLARLLA
ncbi:MAG: response regulator, partial [Candidatus Rokubacteria bacterium]|nr:response regulator [Candidatus Rokubacteria bacterium]